MSDLLPVTQADRDAVQAFHRTMAARLMSDIASERPTLGKDEGDAGTLVQAFARHRLAALDSRAGDAGEVEAPLGFVLEEAEHDAECGCPEETWGTPYGSLNMHLSAGKLSNAHLDNGEGEWEIEATFSSVAEARAAFFGWAIGLHHAPATPAPAVDAQEGDDEGPCTDCEDTGITIQTERACSCEAGDQYRPPAVDAVPAGEVGLRQALGDAINSPKGVVPVSAEPFYDGRAGRVKPAEATPTAYLMTGRWELDPEGRSPGIYMDDPEGGDPICLCVVKRVYHPDLLSASLSHGEGRK